ncbi:hypothetical protein KY285_022854 [Solanum tuberosum]|nr:hypothetical protein KY285_022854 [Solanum tuberosum]
MLSNSTLYCQTVNSCVLEHLEEEVVPRAGLLFDPKVKVLTFDSCKKGKVLSDTKGQPTSEMICKWSCTALAEVAILESLGNIEFIKRCVGLPIAYGCPSLRGFWVMGTAQGLQSLASLTVTSCGVLKQWERAAQILKACAFVSVLFLMVDLLRLLELLDLSSISCWKIAHNLVEGDVLVFQLI